MYFLLVFKEQYIAHTIGGHVNIRSYWCVSAEYIEFCAYLKQTKISY